MVMRHPIAVAEATRKWARTASNTDLIRHWVTAYEIMAEDLPKLRRAVVVRYEDLVEHPDRELARILRLVGLPAAPVAESRARADQPEVLRGMAVRRRPLPVGS